MTTKKTKIDDLASLISATEGLSTELPTSLDTNLFPLLGGVTQDAIPLAALATPASLPAVVPGPVVAPSPAFNPFAQPAGAQVPLTDRNGAPILDETIRAMLIFANLRAQWSLNHWVVRVDNAQNILAQTAGKMSRIQTGIRAGASHEEWQHEINMLLKDTKPTERPLFGPNSR